MHLSKLRKIRLQAGLSQKQLADKIGVNPSHISQLETNPFTQPTRETLQEISRVLEKPINEFWDEFKGEDFSANEQAFLRAYKQFPKDIRLKVIKKIEEIEAKDN